MTWISLICLLALTSSAFGQYAYGGSDVTPQAPILPAVWSQKMIPKTILPTIPAHRVLMHTPTVDTLSSYTQQSQPMPQTFVAPMALPKTLTVQSYAPVVPQLDETVAVPVLTEADILCQGHQPEEVIPIDNHRRFVICLDNGKGVEQQCPAGLFYHPMSQRCERNLGPLEDACSSQPCLNDGQCITAGSSFQCQCAPGFEGVVCELDARICQTQQPCGSSPDIKCQSFRVGAALSYACIYQDGLGYGLNGQQIIPSPCKDKDGPEALAFSQNGFLMCDTHRLFVESCPGGTIWDDIEKACSWPDQQTLPQETKTLTSGYSYGTQIVPQQIQMVIPKHLGLLAQSYGTPVTVPQQLPTMMAAKQFIQPTQSYGADIQIPQEQPKMIVHKQLIQPTQSYGAQLPISQPLKMIVHKQLIQPTQSYGANIPVPQEQPKMIIHKDIQTPETVAPYGAAKFSSY